MKIEKISDTQIKCTLNKSDLASREIQLSELAYGTDKAKELFRDMMQQASYEFGFEANDIPLMIEAIPVSPDCIVLLITKVEDPEELDTRFSRFAPSADSDDSDDEDAPSGEVIDLINDMTNLIAQVKDNISEKADGPTKIITNEFDVPKEPLTRCYSFKNIDDAISACHISTGLIDGSSSLYKTPDDRYNLIFTSSGKDTSFVKLCNILSEYADTVKVNASSENFYSEHYECIISDNAIDTLGRI